MSDNSREPEPLGDPFGGNGYEVQREVDLQVRVPVKKCHYRIRFDVSRSEFQYNPHVRGALVPHILDVLEFLIPDQLGYPLNKPRFVNSVGNRGDHQIGAPVFQAFHLESPTGSNGTVTSRVNLCQMIRMVQNLATCGKIGALDMFQEIPGRQVLLPDRRSTCGNNLAEVVRRERAAHTDRYSGGAVE